MGGTARRMVSRWRWAPVLLPSVHTRTGASHERGGICLGRLYAWLGRGCHLGVQA